MLKGDWDMHDNHSVTMLQTIVSKRERKIREREREEKCYRGRLGQGGRDIDGNVHWERVLYIV